MRKRLFAMVMTLVLCTAIISLPAYATEEIIVPNGTFETDISGWTLRQGTGATGGVFVQDTETYHGGAASFKIQRGSGTAYAYRLVTHDFIEGEIYQVSVWAKMASGVSNVQFKIQTPSYEAIGSNYNFSAYTAEWQRGLITFKAPANLSGIFIYIMNYAPVAGTTVYFDDITVTSGNILVNGGFEDGVAETEISTRWYTTGTAATFYSENESLAYEGNNCGKITGASGNPYLEKVVNNFLPDTRYRLSFNFKYKANSHTVTAGVPRVRIQNSKWVNLENCDFSSATDANDNFIDCSDDIWTKQVIYFKTPADVYNIRIQLLGYTNWDAYYDNLIVVYDDKTTVNLCNSNGFEIPSVEVGKITANVRFVPSQGNTNAVAVMVVNRLENNMKRLVSIDVKNIGITNELPVSLKPSVTVSETENTIVEVYLWDDLSNVKPISDKVTLQ